MEMTMAGWLKNLPDEELLLYLTAFRVNVARPFIMREDKLNLFDAQTMMCWMNDEFSEEHILWFTPSPMEKKMLYKAERKEKADNSTASWLRGLTDEEVGYYMWIYQINTLTHILQGDKDSIDPQAIYDWLFLEYDPNNKWFSTPEDFVTVDEALERRHNRMEEAGKNVALKAYKPGISGGLKLSNFSGSSIHETVINVGHFFGHKFKPWEAVKWTKGVAIAGHALAAFGVVFSVGMQMKSDIDEDKQIQQMKDNRHNIRTAFNDAAKELEKFSNHYSNDVIVQAIDPSINELDKNIAEIRDTRKSRTNEYIQLQALQQDCISLIQEIHSSNL